MSCGESETKDVFFVEVKKCTIPKGPKLGARHVQAVLIFFLMTYSFATRAIVSVGIVAMTDKSATPNPDVPTYVWKDKSIIFSSFYWGYIILPVPGGQLAKIYGTKWFLVGVVVINSAACIATPYAADIFGSIGVIACQFIEGLVQGILYPCVHTLLGKWITPTERSTLGSYSYSGSTFGTIIGMLSAGWISASWAGWPVIFYTFGSIGIIWICFYIVLGYNTPDDHKKISLEEKMYITMSLGNDEEKPEPATPWKQILKSMPIWALTIANIGQLWGYTTLLTEMPEYINKIMKFDMHSNGILSAAPYILKLMFCYIFGPISDIIINRKYISRGISRKMFQAIGVGFPALALTILAFVPEDQNAFSIILLLIAIGVNSAVGCGVLVNMIDLSPNFSGTIMSIVNSIATSASIVAPLVVQVIVSDETNKYQWRIVFLISSAIYIITAIFYFIFGTAETQCWNEALAPIEESKKFSNENDTKVKF